MHTPESSESPRGSLRENRALQRPGSPRRPGSPQGSGSLLIHGADAVLTGLAGEAMRAGNGTDLRITDGRIAEIGRLRPHAGEARLDASGCVIYPGWVNTHHHLFQSLLKGIPAGINLGLVPWLSAVPIPYRRYFDHQYALRLAARVGLVELLLSGCTTVADHQYHYWPGMHFDASRTVFEEAEQLGLRMVLCRGGQTITRALSDAHAPEQAQPESLEGFLASIEHDVKRFHDPGPMAMRRVVSAVTTPNWSCTPEHLRAMASQARSLGIRLHSHLSESFDYVRWAHDTHGCTPLQFVAEHGWVGADVWFAHMVHLSDAEIRLCAETGTGIAHCPQSNARLGSGIARIPEALAAGVPVGLAVDGAASNEAADMASEVHACWLIHRADPRAGERSAMQPGGNAAALRVEDVVRLGSAGGARILGLDGVGVLAPGMAADLAVYDLNDPRYFGLHDPAIGPVASGGRPSLRALLIQGEIVVEHNTIPGVDLLRLRHEAADFVRSIRAG